MKRVIITLAFLLGTCLTVPLVFAEEYDIATLPQPLVSFKDDNGKIRGIAIEIVELAMNNMGHQVKFFLLPWKRAISKTKEGKYDAIIHPFKTPEREKFLDYSSEVFLWEHIVFYRRKDSSKDFDGDFSKLSNVRIGLVRGYSYGPIFDNAMKKYNLSLDEVSTEEKNMKKLMKGRFDFLIGYIYTTEANINQAGGREIVERVPKIIETVPSYIAFSKKRKLTELRDDFDKQLKQFHKDGTYNNILKKYGIDLIPIDNETMKRYGMEK